MTRGDIGELEQTIGQLRSENVRLRRQLTHKTGYAARLELVVKQRAKTVDALNGKLEQVRAQNRRLDEEAERLAEMVRLS